MSEEKQIPKPGESSTQTCKNLFGINYASVLEDFQEQIKDAPHMDAAGQHMVDMMFVFYMAGMRNIMNPDSNFNRKWRLRENPSGDVKKNG